MNESQLDRKIQHDVTQVQKDLNTLKEDGIDKVSKVGEDLEHSTQDVAAWVNSGVTLLSSEFEKVKGDASKTVAHASKTVAHATTKVKKNVGNGLAQYNAKVAEVAKTVPGNVGVLAGRYPWVAISFALMAGFLLRGLLMPHRMDRE